MEKKVHRMSNWILTAKSGKIVLIGDSYTRFEKESDNPILCTGEVISLKHNSETNETFAETCASIYKLCYPHPSYEKALVAMNIKIHDLCFNHCEEPMVHGLTHDTDYTI